MTTLVILSTAISSDTKRRTFSGLVVVSFDELLVEKAQCHWSCLGNGRPMIQTLKFAVVPILTSLTRSTGSNLYHRAETKIYNYLKLNINISKTSKLVYNIVK